MKHKHADVLIAIAEGKEVQWRSSIESVWVESCLIDVAHICNGEFRIKPEPKPDIVRYVACDVRPDGYSVTPSKYDDANLKLTFDGETGKLKSAEVIS